MDPLEEILLEIEPGLLNLFAISRGIVDGHEIVHGIFQGSHEAALFEAQGGTIGTGGFNHLNQVMQSATAIQARRDVLNLALNRLLGLDPAVGARVRALCEPVLRLTSDYLKVAADTNAAANALRQSDPTRFQGVMLGQGGLGPEIGRTQQALVSNQLNAMSAQLTARGIEPRLIPAARTSLQPVLASIRQLPIDGREAAVKLAGALGAMRVVLQQTLVRASLVGRARLIAALLGIENALVSFGSRLTTPLIIDRRTLRQIMGVPDVT